MVYISGPMSGKPDSNYQAFMAVSRRLREQGLEVICPAESFGGNQDLPKTAYMRHDFECVLKADALVRLPGWQESEGALAEVEMARLIGIPIWDEGLPF